MAFDRWGRYNPWDPVLWHQVLTQLESIDIDYRQCADECVEVMDAIEELLDESEEPETQGVLRADLMESVASLNTRLQELSTQSDEWLRLMAACWRQVGLSWS
jgi:hypothetical protein